MNEGLTTQKMFVHLPKLRKFYANFTQITQILRKLRKFYANYANLRKFFLRSYTQILSGQPLGHEIIFKLMKYKLSVVIM